MILHFFVGEQSFLFQESHSDMLIEVVKLLLEQLDILAIVDTFVDEIDVVSH